MGNSIAAALEAARQTRAEGGGFHPHVKKPHVAFKHAKRLHVGPIHSAVAGRTDHLPMHVPSGSYVIPADITSGIGEGNTIAGFKHLRRLFEGAPYGGGSGPYGQSGGPYGEHLATGGATDSEDEGVPIVAAGGEYVVAPHAVRYWGGGDMDRGHRILDRFVKEKRKELVQTLKHLPGPKRD